MGIIKRKGIRAPGKFSGVPGPRANRIRREGCAEKNGEGWEKNGRPERTGRTTKTWDLMNAFKKMRN